MISLLAFLLLGPSVQDLSRFRLPLGDAGALSSDYGTGGGLSPAGVTDLRAQALSDSSVVLTWTEVQSSSTAIPRYDVRFDSLGKFLWSTAADLVIGGCGAPIVSTRAAGGRPRACVITGLQPHVAYQFQMVSYTGTLNTTGAVFGPLSNIAEATTAERIGTMLLWRSPLMRDTILGVQRVEVNDWGSWALYVRPTFGDYRGTLEDSSGAILARAYLLITKP